MVQSNEILENLQQILPQEIWKNIESEVPNINSISGKKSQKRILTFLNRSVVDTAIKQNDTKLLNFLSVITDDESDDLFTKIITQYFNTKNILWFQAIFLFSDKMGKKSDQSRIFAGLARDLIEKGVSQSNPQFIKDGMIVLQKISFRKHRSEIMIDIIPLLIVWAITTRQKQLIYTSLKLIEEIGDISKRAILHSELAKALATIAILEKDRSSFFDSINRATEIHQKNRRHDCLVFIIEKGSKSSFGKEMAEVPQFISNFKTVHNEAYLEIISTLIEQMFDRVKDKAMITETLGILCKNNPSVTETLILDLLRKAERSGDPWFLTSVLNLQSHSHAKGPYPLRELVRAGISVANNTHKVQFLLDLIPIIDTCSDHVISTRIFLQFSQIMLVSDDFNSALVVFQKISPEMEGTPQYADTLTHLLKKAVLNDRIPDITSVLLTKISVKVVNTTISRATTELCKDVPHAVLINHLISLTNLLNIHPNRDQILLENISILIERGFLDTQNPDILISLTDSIKDNATKEKVISLIVIKIAKVGVQARNRDMLQRAVGLTCAIEGQNTRSATLSSIIDEAAILAAHQGDLNLLLRMKDWSSSLLEPDLATSALANIIEGIIKYAINKQSPVDLEEAARIAEEVNDPALKAQLLERIAEGFVVIGCLLLKNAHDPIRNNKSLPTFYSFKCGMEIIKTNSKSPQISLKIASFIDIILSYSQSSHNPEYAIMLAFFVSEIKNPFERDAMMERIVSCMKDKIPHTSSTDPYEIMANYLLRNDIEKTNPIVIDLLYQIIQKINDPVIRFSGICNLADSAVKSGNIERAARLLDQIRSDVDNLPSQYQKVLILTDIASIYTEIDPEISKKLIFQILLLIDHIEGEKSSEIRRQVVISIIKQNSIIPDERWEDIVLSVIEKINDPIDYIHSMVAIFPVLRQDKNLRNTLIAIMANKTEQIYSPFERASTTLEVVILALQNNNIESALHLLEDAEDIVGKINIPYIADIIRETIIRYYLLMYQNRKEKKFFQSASRVINSLDNDESRIHYRKQNGLTEPLENTSRYKKIKMLSEKVMRDKAPSSQIAALEHFARSEADRGKEALFFSDLAIFFRKGGDEKLSQRMIHSAVKEARIIRPLSRRAYLMCDIALKIYTAGCEDAAQEILDYAIDSATNIRQPSIRDEVFDELGQAIKIMQRI
jgi:hypothetical protein